MKENLSFASLGNGVTVWDKNRRELGDSKIVAHISRERKISILDKDLSDEAKKAINGFARTGNVRMSVSQPEFVMLKPLGVPQKILEKTRKEYSKIAGEEIVVKVMEYSDDIYAFGSELACLKLSAHFAGKELRIRHGDGSMWMFVVFNDFKK